MVNLLVSFCENSIVCQVCQNIWPVLQATNDNNLMALDDATRPDVLIKTLYYSVNYAQINVTRTKLIIE